MFRIISQEAAGSTQINVYGPKILKRDFEAGFYTDHFKKVRMGLDFKMSEISSRVIYLYGKRWIRKEMTSWFTVGLRKAQ